MSPEQLLTTASPVMPVMVIENINHVLPLAEALLEGGISVFEITLRTSCALEAIEQIKTQLPECLVGAGTVINTEHLKTVRECWC